jgi:hypothetical protein
MMKKRSPLVNLLCFVISSVGGYLLLCHFLDFPEVTTKQLLTNPSKYSRRSVRLKSKVVTLNGSNFFFDGSQSEIENQIRERVQKAFNTPSSSMVKIDIIAMTPKHPDLHSGESVEAVGTYDPTSHYLKVRSVKVLQ